LTFYILDMLYYYSSLNIHRCTESEAHVHILIEIYSWLKFAYLGSKWRSPVSTDQQRTCDFLYQTAEGNIHKYRNGMIFLFHQLDKCHTCHSGTLLSHLLSYRIDYKCYKNKMQTQFCSLDNFVLVVAPTCSYCI